MNAYRNFPLVIRDQFNFKPKHALLIQTLYVKYFRNNKIGHYYQESSGNWGSKDLISCKMT